MKAPHSIYFSSKTAKSSPGSKTNLKIDFHCNNIAEGNTYTLSPYSINDHALSAGVFRTGYISDIIILAINASCGFLFDPGIF